MAKLFGLTLFSFGTDGSKGRLTSDLGRTSAHIPPAEDILDFTYPPESSFAKTDHSLGTTES